MNDSATHPALDQFRKAMQDCAVTPDKAVAFNKWRNNPNKCTGPVKEAADKLWAEYESMKSACNSPAPAPRSIPSSSGHISRTPNGGSKGAGAYQSRQHTSQPQRADNINAAEPDILGEPFHNPYTFIPFPQKAPNRHTPTPLSIDELEGERERFTGILDLNIKLLSPLLSNSPEPVKDDGGHKTYAVLTIGDDVIVPATGIRGALRTLMTILTGGTLGYIDDEAWLCQGRDARLGPASKATKGQVPDHAFLARVVSPGGFGRSGEVELGRTILVKADDLDRAAQRSGIGTLPRPRPGQRVEYLWTNEVLSSVTHNKDDKHQWQVKLSGRPIMLRGKREGLFLGNGKKITLGAELWASYAGRNRHGDHPELRKGDLVWLEPKSFGLAEIRSAEDVKSIQWARWGREGEHLLSIIRQRHPHQLPDAFNPDGLVDEVTDLFGQTPREDIAQKTLDKNKPAFAFAARIRPCNLVFPQAKSKVQRVTLAPLAPPHPGCAAFYRALNGDLASAADHVSNHKTPLRGYKVYRTTSESGALAPWLFTTQGVYGDRGELKSEQQKVNKTCDLLPPDSAPAGTLRITVRALSRRELTLLLAACAVDWRLGGGKPLGLGHCRVVSAALREFHDDGSLGPAISFHRASDAIAQLPEPFATELAADAQLVERMHLWQTSQTPVQKLRYPRAVVENRNKKSRGGHVWFQRHASPRKAAREGAHPQGLQVMHLTGQLRDRAGAEALRAQPLPPLEAGKPEADVLYGYDLFAGDSPDWTEQTRDRRTLYRKLEPFDEKKHARANDQSGGFHGQSRKTRQDTRRQRQ